VARIDSATPNSPGWWLVALADKLSEKQNRRRKLRAYMDGDAPLPEGAEKLRDAYRSFQKKARTNFGELAVEAVAERMIPTGFILGDDTQGSDEAARIWNANNMDIFAPDVHGDMLGVADGYVIVGPPDEETGVAVITREDPELVITAHDPRRPQQVIAALKMFRDDVFMTDFAYLYLPGAVFVARKKSGERGGNPDINAHGWEWDERLSGDWPQGFESMIPVTRFRNRRGKGEFETHTDILDRINYMILQRLVIAAMQAYRQRAVIMSEGSLPETDEAGNPIQYSEVFRPGPGALWELPEGASLWESQTTDLTPLLTAVKDDIRDFGAVTRTPMSMLLPDGANQTAEGASFAREGLIFKAEDRIKRATYGLNRVMSQAFMFSGDTARAAALNLRTTWAMPERYSLSERADASQKSQDIPWRTRMTDIWGFSPDEVARMESERVNDAMLAAALAPPQPPQAAEQEEPVTDDGDTA